MRYWKHKPTPGYPYVTFVIASYLNDDLRQCDALSALLASLYAQTYRTWRAVVVHDGPLSDEARKRVSFPDMPIAWDIKPKRLHKHGHPHRREAALRWGNDAIVFTNADNLYVPVFLNAMVHEFAHGADFVHCDVLHSHKMWDILRTYPQPGKIDMGCALLSKRLVEKNEWHDFSFRGDGIYLSQLARSAKKVVRVPHALFIHN